MKDLAKQYGVSPEEISQKFFKPINPTLLKGNTKVSEGLQTIRENMVSVGSLSDPEINYVCDMILQLPFDNYDSSLSTISVLRGIATTPFNQSKVKDPYIDDNSIPDDLKILRKLLTKTSIHI